MRILPSLALLAHDLKLVSIAWPARRILTPHRFPLNAHPSATAPVGVLTVVVCTGRQLRPIISLIVSMYRTHPLQPEDASRDQRKR